MFVFNRSLAAVLLPLALLLAVVLWSNAGDLVAARKARVATAPAAPQNPHDAVTLAAANDRPGAGR